MRDLIRETYETRRVFLGHHSDPKSWVLCEVWTYIYRDGGVERLIKRKEVT